MKAFRIASMITGTLLLAGFEFAFGADDLQLASQYFGHIETPCATREQCKEFTDLVIRASGGNECNEVDRVCEVGQELLKKVFGTVYRQTLPDFIVYLDDSQTGKTFSLKKHPPLLMWQGKNTPHLMGARAIYVMVFARHKLDIQATVTSDSQFEPNPLIGILGVLNSPNINSPDVKPSETKDAEFIWHPLNGNEYGDDLKTSEKMITWLGTARIAVPDNSINRLTISYGLPPKTDDNKNTDASNSANRDQDTSSKVDNQKSEKDKYSGDFLAATGHFSNSPERNAAVSFALGTTFNSRNTSIASGGSNVNIDGFMFAKFYIYRPYLYATSRMTRYSPSLGIVIGTNVNGTIFNDIVVGVSVGHLVGNVGVIAGLNSIAGISNADQGRKSRAFLGMEYTF